MIIRFLIYGALGCLIEVLWTGIGSLRSRDKKLSSNTSLWMFFIYGMVVVLEPFFVLLSPVHFIIRGLTYAALIYAGEFVTGLALQRAGACPWDYSHTKYHIRGIIRADYLPCWIALGLFYEWVYFAVR